MRSDPRHGPIRARVAEGTCVASAPVESYSPAMSIRTVVIRRLKVGTRLRFMLRPRGPQP
ncbi:hypothetical protein [Lysobacter gummosus]|uniref:hypothetical protein n=1 Tax=Lysobacter gummosus TaxID=262324 RepID=UPI003641EDE9